MLSADVTVDTNVLMHADNPTERRHVAAKQFAMELLRSDLKICVDPGFDREESKNRSRIGSEYLRWLTTGGLGYQVIATLASSERVSFVQTKVKQTDLKAVNILVTDKTDRVFLRVAMNSVGHTLVSHDLKAFPQNRRARVRRELGVSVLDAAGCAFPAPPPTDPKAPAAEPAAGDVDPTDVG